MSKTFTVEGDITTADVRTLITTQGSVTAPSSVTPANAKKIDKIIIAATSEGLADGSQVTFIRLGGNAVKNGEQTIVVSAQGRIAAQAGSDAAPQNMTPLIIEDVDIEVASSDTITIAAEGAGTDTGTIHIVVTLIYG
jgi:phenylalanyl-tRNA synthetase beta subunit